MISSIEWVPAGVADPNPKKYEFSRAELDLIEMMEKHNMGETTAAAAANDEVVEQQKTKKEKKQTKKEKSKATTAATENTLPADLRMDEYSSDEEEDEAARGLAIGKLLVEDGDAFEEETEEPQNDKEEPQNDNVSMESGDSSDGESGDDDDDDDFGDIPDTREYTPVDLDGLNSIGFSQVGTNAPNYMEDDDDDDDSDAEDVLLSSSDAIVVVAKTEEEFAALEVHVYEQDTGNLFVHHDIPLPAFPLCLSHGDIGPTGAAGNFCAVGTFGPGIEIWNLDVLNALEPSCVLGGEDTSMADEIMRLNMMNNNNNNNNGMRHNNTLSGGGGGGSLKPGSHTDAVMALSWNKVHRQVIASGSADCTVKLWDVTQAHSADKANATTLNHHRDKVQSVLWHPTEGTLLATGSYDRTIALVDARSTDHVKTVKIPGDCESLAWDPFNPQYLTAASEDGTVVCWDVRKFSTKTPLWSIVASEFGGVSDLSYNPHVPGMMATSSVDKTVTIWDTMGNSSTQSPTAKMNKDMKVGKLFTLNFYPSSPWLMGCAGGTKEIAIWDMAHDDTIQKCFGGRIDPSLAAKNDDVGSRSSEKTEQQIIQPSFDSLINSNADKTTPSDNKAKHKPSISNKKKKNKKKAHSRASR